MGENPKTVFNVGCPSIDAIANIDLKLSKDFFVKNKGVGIKINQDKPYLVILQHPVTTEYGKGFFQIEQTLKAIESIKMQTVWLWPNIDAGSDDISKGLRMYREKYNPDYIHFYKNFEVQDYARLINNCKCLIGNSSSAIREGSFLGVPAVNIGTRQNGREMGKNIINVDYNSTHIEDAIKKQLINGKYDSSKLYGDGKAGEKIAKILEDAKINIQKTLNY